MTFDAVYYEPQSLEHPLGAQLRAQFAELPWHEIESHNRIPEMQEKSNADFPRMKRLLIIGTRKTHKYTPNAKISDYLVPYTSSGCTAMCLYCYLVCNYNKCAYLRLFTNREEMLARLLRVSHKEEQPCTFEIGSNSDLLLENTITGNLNWTIERFAREGRGRLTFPTKFDSVEPLLTLDHREKTIFRMSVNPPEIIRTIELGTAPLDRRLSALIRMHEAGYPCGILIAPVILQEGWAARYAALFDTLAQTLPASLKREMTIEVIFMTYSFVQRAINADAFPNAPALYDQSRMSGRGRGKYGYVGAERTEAELFLRTQLDQKLPESRLVYIC